jgi:hypothetical protein
VSDQAKWLIILFGIVVVGGVGLTVLDKYDERCRENPRVLQREQSHLEDGQVVIDRPLILETCDGFLPW